MLLGPQGSGIPVAHELLGVPLTVPQRALGGDVAAREMLMLEWSPARLHVAWAVNGGGRATTDVIEVLVPTTRDTQQAARNKLANTRDMLARVADELRCSGTGDR